MLPSRSSSLKSVTITSSVISVANISSSVLRTGTEEEVAAVGVAAFVVEGEGMIGGTEEEEKEATYVIEGMAGTLKGEGEGGIITRGRRSRRRNCIGHMFE